MFFFMIFVIFFMYFSVFFLELELFFKKFNFFSILLMFLKSFSICIGCFFYVDIVLYIFIGFIWLLCKFNGISLLLKFGLWLLVLLLLLDI